MKRPDFRDIRLSKRELVAAEPLGRGLSNKEIAEIMGIKVSTVKAYVRSLLRLSGCKRREEFIRIYGKYFLGLPEFKKDKTSTPELRPKASA